MMHPYLTLNDGTEVVHSDMGGDGRVKVYIERPDERDCFHHATCWLPGYQWEDVYGFSPEEMGELERLVEANAHLIMEFAQEGGFDYSPAV